MGRYTRKGVSKISFVVTIASQAAPTIAEINAGTDLTPQTNDVAGFSFENSPINVPDLATTFVPQIPGEDAAADSTLTFYDDDASSTIRTALAKGNAGFIVLMPYGKTTTKRCEVWPVKSTGYNDEWTTGNESAKAHCKFAVTAAPNQAATVT